MWEPDGDKEAAVRLSPAPAGRRTAAVQLGGGPADRAAASCRGSAIGRLEPRDVAEWLSVRVVLSDLGTSMWGVTMSSDCVAISSRLPETERRYALAHELAHVLARRAPGPRHLTGWREERFADAFARELLMPKADVRQATGSEGRVPSAALADGYGVDEGTVLLQAAAVGLGPALQTTPDGAVLCVHCGHRAHVPGCLCRAARTRVRERDGRGADGDTVGTGPGWRTTCW